MFFSLPVWFTCLWVLFIAGAVTALPTINSENQDYPGGGLRARRIDVEDVSDIAQTAVAPIVGATAVAIFLIIFVAVSVFAKAPKKEDMGTSNPLPVAERPPWAS
ncbi:hypothetical protein K438DRAFT_1994981 [Mycena galopus ATCC 62051]|nr:hypothetical protein K438DRAFT_1994981 [Mycena galopus ATCC 62051]